MTLTSHVTHERSALGRRATSRVLFCALRSVQTGYADKQHGCEQTHRHVRVARLCMLSVHAHNCRRTQTRMPVPW
eukprot:6610077-Prymnesium_polylepis.3